MNSSLLAPTPLAVLSLLLMLLFPSVRAQGQTYIFGRADFAVGSSPMAIAAGDFNNDGLIDFAVVSSGDAFGNYAPNTVSVLLGRADGTFAPQITFPTGPNPVAIAAADFNGDGRVDLVVANANCLVPQQINNQCAPSTVSILFGNGDGTFQPHIDLAVGAIPSSVVAADFNGDGKVDLAVANTQDATVSILLGNGDGTFQPRTTFATAATGIMSWQSVTVGDFNNDGKLDLAVTCNSVISVLPGKGDGTFGPHIDSGVGGFFLAAGDFNGDGKLDLAVSGPSSGGAPTISVLLGIGDGAFVLQTQYDGGNSVAVADVNGDGKLDLLVPLDLSPAEGDYVEILLGNGDGTFQPAVNYGTASSPTSLWVADLNGDGKLDLAVVTSPGCTFIRFQNCVPQAAPGRISVLLGFGDGTFVGQTDYPFRRQFR